tara:strand:+ start:845 stop:1036 length:192 start_codon:yes stop_codon:yes gene_type:complete
MKKILVRDNKGNYGHAEVIGKNETNDISVEHLRVRMFDSYENVHITNWSSFLIYYEVLDEIED